MVSNSPNRCAASRQHSQGGSIWVRADMDWGGLGCMHVGQGMWWVAWNASEIGGIWLRASAASRVEHEQGGDCQCMWARACGGQPGMHPGWVAHGHAMSASATLHMLNTSEVVVTSRVGRWWQRLVARRVWWHRRGGRQWVYNATAHVAPCACICG